MVISDELEASERTLSETYRTQIATFINESSLWYNKSVEAVKKWGSNRHKITPNSDDIELINLFILFEENEDERYGLEFSVEFDIEHGCGLKIKGKDFEIVEIGEGDVAFC